MVSKHAIAKRRWLLSYRADADFNLYHHRAENPEEYFFLSAGSKYHEYLLEVYWKYRDHMFKRRKREKYLLINYQPLPDKYSNQTSASHIFVVPFNQCINKTTQKL